MTTAEMMLRLGLGMILGTVIGAERQWRASSAGLRTNSLVSIGSTLFVLRVQRGPAGLDGADSTPPASPPRSCPASAFSAPV